MSTKTTRRIDGQLTGLQTLATEQDRVIKSVNKQRGYRTENKEVEILCYANGAILMTQDQDYLQKLVHRLNTSARELDMTISAQKTKTIIINEEPSRCKLKIDGVSIEQVMEIKYLKYRHISTENEIKNLQSNNTTNNDVHIRNKTRHRDYSRQQRCES